MMNFNKKHISFTPTLPSNNWQKILDSSDIKWMGAGATMPEMLMPEEALTIPPQSFALYEVKH